MKKLILTILAIIMMLSLTACSGGGSMAAADYAGGPAGAAAPAEAPRTPEYGYDDYELYDEAPAAADTGVAMGSGSAVTDGRKITFSASISLNTKQFDADYAKIYALIDSSGGFVASETMTDNSSYYDKLVGRYTYITARVPAGEYNNFIDAVAAIGEVTSKNKWSEDLTTEYFDTEARVEMLEIRKERLMGYLLEAEKAEDIVAFERELSDVLYDLDFYKGNIRRLDRLVDYATIDINLTELITPETIGKDGEPLGDRASEAFSLSLVNVSNFLQDFAVGFAGALPVLILLLIIAVIIWAIVRVTRPLRRKLRERREAREAEKREKRMKSQPYPPPQYWQQPQYQPPQAPAAQPAPQTPTAPQAPPQEQPQVKPKKGK